MAANKIPGSTLRTDILPDELKEPSPRIIVQRQYQTMLTHAKRMPDARSVTPGTAKDIIESMELFKKAIDDYERRQNLNERDKIVVSYDTPDKDIEYPSVTLSVDRREPGSYSQGAPFEGTVRNLSPVLREEKDDPDNPGYRLAILGYYYDNLISLTCWALSNKEVESLALKVETIMEQYRWYFAVEGIGRVLYWGRGGPMEKTIRNNILYGRSINYYVRTEKITALSEKELEIIYINLIVKENVV